MMGKTHRAGGVVFMLGAFEIMNAQGMLLPDVNPFVQLAVMYPASQWGSTFPDLDHHWESVGAKTPFNKLVHFLLHLTQPKHRSWQTHSIFFTGGLLALIYALVLLGNATYGELGSTDWVIIRLITVGVIVGVASHMFLDFINPSGIHLYPGFKIRAVPKTAFFATGGRWETIVYYVCMVVSMVFLINIILEGGFDISLWDTINFKNTDKLG